jgi:hypothetical protein
MRLAHSSIASAASSLILASLLSGCAVANLSSGLSSGGSPETLQQTISGIVHGGQQPISGATVKLYVTGASAYGSGATLVGQSVAPTTIGGGAFTITPTFSSASCTSPSTQFVYLTVAGGDPTGQTLTANNHAILETSVLFPCTSVPSVINITEASTVATAYALSGFTTVTNSPGGFASVNIGAPASNSQGLADAAANTLALVAANGFANSSTATMLLPTATVNSLANTIASCVNTSEYTSTACATMFGLATPPNGTQPTNVYQALVNIAKYPGSNVAGLLNVGTPSGPFQPTLPGGSGSSTLNDLTLGIAFPNTTLAGAKTASATLAIDATDNVWILGAATTTFNYVTELSNASTGYTVTNNLASTSTLAASHNVRNGAFDTLGNLWMADGSVAQVIEIPAGAGVAGATAYPFTSLNTNMAANDYTVAVDGSNNVWTSSYRAQGSCQGPASTTTNTVCEFLELVNGAGSYTAANTFNGAQVGNLTTRGMAADAKTGNIWAANYGSLSPSTTPGNTVEILTPSTGATATVTVGAVGAAPVGVAIDASSNAWVTTPTIAGLYFVPAGSNSSSTIAAANVTNPPSTILNTTNSPASTATTPVAVGGLKTDTYDAIDGAGNVWIANAGYTAIAEYSPTYNCGGGCTGGFLSPNYGFSPSIATVASPTNQALFTCTGTATITCSIVGGAITSSNTAIAIDRAGSVWTLASTAGTLVEIIGTAAPTNPIQAAGQYGVQP